MSRATPRMMLATIWPSSPPDPRRRNVIPVGLPVSRFSVKSVGMIAA